MFHRHLYLLFIRSLNTLYSYLFIKTYSFLTHWFLRLMIAALHFNENSSRPSATTKEGDLQYKISFPKFKHGDYSVRKKSVDPTYGKHIHLLMNDLLVIKQQCVRLIYFYFDKKCHLHYVAGSSILKKMPYFTSSQDLQAERQQCRKCCDCI